jgi:pimeloyl-[acyl-carrier protein] methyl ester esterase
MSLYVERFGSGPELVLVHGWGMHGGIWAGLSQRLAPRFRVTVVDLPGHGRSPLATRMDIDGIADELAALVDQPAAWLGWSLGGLITLALAQRHPPRVRALVLVDTTPRFVQGADWTHGMASEVFAEFARSLELDYRATLLRFLSLQGGAGEAGRALVKSLRSEMFRRGEPQLAALRAGLAILRDTDLRAALGGIRSPALVVHGSHDRLTPPAAGEFLAARLPQARHRLFRGAGHAPFLAEPEAFAAAVEEFAA